MYVNLKFKNSKMFNFCLWFMLSTKQSQMENVAGNTLRKWQRCNFLELDTDWATHENIIYIHILWTFVHIPIYRGAHTPYIMAYIYVADNAPCVNKKEGTKSRKKRERRDTMYFILLLWPQHVCACVYMCILLSYICIYIYSVCRSGHSRFCWCQQRRRRKVFGNWTAFIGLGHAWAAADCFWVGIGTGRAYVTVCTLNIDHLREFFEVLR